MRSTFSGLPRAAWIIFAGTVVNRLGYVVTPFLVFYLGSRGILTEQTPYVLGALGAGNLIGPMIGGLLADRLGRRPTMLIGLVGTAASQGLLFAAPNVLTMAAAAVLLSGAGSMVGPAAGALLTDSARDDHRRAAFSLFHWAVNIGTAVAGMLGGFLATRGYWLLFTVDAASSLAYAAIAITLLPPGRRGRSSTGAGYRVVLKDPLMRALLPLFGIALMIYSLTEVCLPLAIRDHGLSTTTLGLMATLNAVLVVILQPVATGALARFPQIPVYVCASVLIAGGIALTGVAQTHGPTPGRSSCGRSARPRRAESPARSSRASPPTTRAADTRAATSGRGASPGSRRCPPARPCTPPSARERSGGSARSAASAPRSASAPSARRSAVVRWLPRWFPRPSRPCDGGVPAGKAKLG